MIIISSKTYANCLLIIKNEHVIFKQGNCDKRYAPRCSFNIALSLIGFNEGILIDENLPELAFKPGYPSYIKAWQQNHTPQLWIKNSYVWYSQILAQKIGTQKLANYLQHFNYGNHNIDKNQDNALNLPNFWMSSGSLTISPNEQVEFLQKLVKHKLPLQESAYAMTSKIMFVENLNKSWTLYGKTGTGNLPLPNGALDYSQEGGWFIGWATNGTRTLIFANYIEQKVQKIPAGRIAKNALMAKIKQLITKS